MNIRQRKDGDCGTAALAMAFEQAYEDVYVHLMQVERKNRGGKGLSVKELQAVASRMNRPLRYRRKFDLEDDEGVLGVQWKGRAKKQAGHWVCLKKGMILDPAADLPQTASDWLEQNGARATCLLSEE